MRDARTTITKDVFNRVRHLQVVKSYPPEGIHRETGVSNQSQRDIRKAKTWPTWTAQLQAKRKTPAIAASPEFEIDKAIDLGKKITAAEKVAVVNPIYATKSDLTKVAEAQIIDAGKLWDAVEKLQKDNAKLVNRLKRHAGKISGLKSQVSDLNSELTDIDKVVGDLSTFRSNVKASPFLSHLLKRAAKRVKGGQR